MDQITQAIAVAPRVGNIRLYVCGGVATEICKVFEQDRGNTAVGYGALMPCYVDTSDSDLDSSISREHVYLLEKKTDGEEVHGSGKVRLENGEDIARVIKDIVQRFQPGDFNIIVSSTSGGSGSVFAPMLAKELLSRGFNTVAFGVGTTGDIQEIENNVKTLKSYDAIARLTKNPLPMFYTQYEKGRKSLDVQEQVREVISGLTVLFSRQNRGIDTRDLANWQNYTNVPAASHYEAKLVSLHMVDSDEKFNEVGQIITVASLAQPGADIDLPTIPAYRLRGISSVKAVAAPVHFIVAEGQLIEAVTQFEKNLRALTEQQNSVVKNRALSSDADKPDANGIVW
jgi:hypothetical protein